MDAHTLKSMDFRAHQDDSSGIALDSHNAIPSPVVESSVLVAGGCEMDSPIDSETDHLNKQELHLESEQCALRPSELGPHKQDDRQEGHLEHRMGRTLVGLVHGCNQGEGLLEANNVDSLTERLGTFLGGLVLRHFVD